MPILVLDKQSGTLTVEGGRIDQYARRLDFRMVPALLDGDVCVKLLRDGEWVATAQFIERA